MLVSKPNQLEVTQGNLLYHTFDLDGAHNDTLIEAVPPSACIIPTPMEARDQADTLDQWCPCRRSSSRSCDQNSNKNCWFVVSLELSRIWERAFWNTCPNSRGRALVVYVSITSRGIDSRSRPDQQFIGYLNLEQAGTNGVMTHVYGFECEGEEERPIMVYSKHW